MKHKETKLTAIPPEVKEKVKLRDKGRCIVCGAPGIPCENKALKGYDSQLGLSQFEYGLFIDV